MGQDEPYYMFEWHNDYVCERGGDNIRFYDLIFYTTINNSHVERELVSLSQHYGLSSGKLKISAYEGGIKLIRTENSRVQIKSIFDWNKPTGGVISFYITDFFIDAHGAFSYEFNIKNKISCVSNYIGKKYKYYVDYNLKFYPVFKNTTDKYSLSYYNNVKISFTSGFPEEVYKGRWRYKIANGSWETLKSGISHSVTICGKDLMDEATVINNIGKTVQFYIDNPIKRDCETVTMKIEKPFLEKTFIGEYLPSDRKITLSYTGGFPRYIYRWQYSIAEGEWIDVPGELIKDDSPHCIKVCSKDLMDVSTIRQNVGKTIQFRIYSDKVSSESIPLTVLNISLPIKDIIPIHPRCYNERGKLQILLREPLRPDEDVLWFIDGKSLDKNNWMTITQDRQSVFIDSLSVGVDSILTLQSQLIVGDDVYTSDYDTIIIGEYLKVPAPVKFTALHSDVLCHGDSSGTITVKPTGGTGVYSIMLNNDEAANGVTGEYTFDSLAAGKYFVKVFDTHECSYQDTIKITQPEALLSIDNISLTEPKGFHTHDGQIEVQVSGGTPPYTVYCKDSLDDSLEVSYPLELQADGNFKNVNLCRGSYTIIVKDSHECTVVQDVILKSPEELRVWIKQLAGINCYGNTLGILTDSVVGGVGGYQYKWVKIADKDSSISQPQYLAAGRYRVVVTDANGITATAEHDLTQPDTISIAFPVVEPPTCGNQHRGHIEAAVQGGTQPYSYDWGNGDNASYANISSGGLHTLNVIDANGCEAVNSIIVEAPGELSVSHRATAPSCHGLSDGRIELEVSGGIEPYTVRWADEMWNTPATIPALAQRGPNALCDEDSEVPDFTGSTLRTNLPAGRYEAVVTDDTGCEVVVIVVLEQPEPIALWLGHDITLCSGARTLLCAQSNREGLRYSWHTPWTFAPQTEPQLWADAAGSYVVTATDSAGCMASDTVRVLQGSEPLPLDITAPSSAAARATVHAVNLSPDGVEQVRWILPTEAEVVRTNDVEAVFIMPRSGTYQIAFEARTDRCTATIGQPLEILDTLVLPGSDDVPLIQQFLLSPSGLQLAVRVELREASRMVLNLLTADGRLIDQHVQPSAKTHTHRFNLSGLPAGEYQVVLQVGGQVATMRFTKRE